MIFVSIMQVFFYKKFPIQINVLEINNIELLFLFSLRTLSKNLYGMLK